MPFTLAHVRRRLPHAIRPWRPLLPIFAAEFIVWMGFGALIPLLPMYLVQHGLEPASLGFVVAVWPAARFIGEPVFGWVADRWSRWALMVMGIFAVGVSTLLPVLVAGPLAFVVFRAVSGFASAAYDPAARSYLADATDEGGRGRAFGIYGAVQTAGGILGPVLGGAVMILAGSLDAVFVVAALSCFAATASIALFLRDRPRGERLAAAVAAAEEAAASGSAEPAPARLWNRLLIAAIVVNAGLITAAGTYETVWTIYLGELGASVALITGVFSAWGIPMLILSPIAGRWIDDHGAWPALVPACIVAAAVTLAYAFIANPLLAIPLALTDAVAFAFVQPALFTMVAKAAPVGRSATTQGVYGASGTATFGVSAIPAGLAYGLDRTLPFWLGAIAIVVCLGIGFIVRPRAAACEPSAEATPAA